MEQKRLNEVVRETVLRGRNDPCLCGSGSKFKSCCGNKAKDRLVPRGIELVPDYLSQQQCRQFVSLAQQAETEKLKVINKSSDENGDLVRRHRDSRITDVVRLGDKHVLLQQLVAGIFQQRFPAAKQKERQDHKADEELAWYENPQLLKYSPGGRFDRHTDSDYFDQATASWKKAVDRDISLLLYINDDFEGGELYFDLFDYTVRPQPGLLVLFPSDYRYTHAAKPVTAGIRYSIVSWAAFKASQKVKQTPGRAALFFHKD